LSRSDDPSETPPLPLIERLQFVQRQTTLLIVLCVIAVAAYFLTRSLASTTHALHRSDAARWYAMGQERLADGDLPRAITALRRAAAMDAGARGVHLALASAHEQAGQVEQARDVLHAALERFRDDPEISLRLATLEAEAGGVEEAIRHYQAALLGLWGPEQLDQRRQLREHYIHFLLEQGMAPRALSETLLLAGEIPDDAPSHVKVGSLLQRAGDSERALQQFEIALQHAPQDPEALSRAGEAAFETGDYRAASRYLQRARDTERSQRLLPVVDLVLALDPLRPGLLLRERHRRVALAATLLAQRVARCRTAACPEGAGCAGAEALVKEIATIQTALRRAAREADTVEAGLGSLVDFANRAATVCPPTDADPPVARALTLIAASHGVAP
jgi:tetratricopeptide (TPR) repeat protein